MILQMNRVKIVAKEHPVHPVPQHAKPATKESLMVKVVVLVTIVWKKRFKIKTQNQVPRALLVPQDGNNQTKVLIPASVSIGKHQAVAKTLNTWMTPQPMPPSGNVNPAPRVVIALVQSLGHIFHPNLGGGPSQRKKETPSTNTKSLRNVCLHPPVWVVWILC
jgi:hypothetical protein